ncbi:hypothetical protein ABZV75_06000 [Streptomyces flaveolus]|uniref:hypothetical protein n=1 Tax=Streptomyces flaveolus TaxID=67297 RepID=UPI0033BE28B8
MEGKLMTRKTVASLGILIAALAVPITAASPASAVTRQCVGFLQSESYEPDAAKVNACYIAGHYSGWTDKAYKWQICYTELVRLDVTPSHASQACDWAQTNE